MGQTQNNKFCECRSISRPLIEIFFANGFLTPVWRQKAHKIYRLESGAATTARLPEASEIAP